MKLLDKFTTPKKQDTLPVRISRKRIYILPTREGVIFTGVLFAMLLGSVNYNNNLGFLLTFLLGGMFFVSIWHTFRTINGLTIKKCTAKPVFLGQTAIFQISVSPTNTDRHAVNLTFSKGNSIKTDVHKNIENSISINAVPDKRGWFSPGMLTISSVYPIGLFYAWSRLSIAPSCLVYPKPVSHPYKSTDFQEDSNREKRLPAANGTGSDESHDFKELKEYTPGDPMKRIAWKSFSRGQGLLTKHFSGNRRPKALMIDMDSFGKIDAESALSGMCHQVLVSAGRNETFGIKIKNLSIMPGTGEGHKNKCLKALAEYGNGP